MKNGVEGLKYITNFNVIFIHPSPPVTRSKPKTPAVKKNNIIIRLKNL